MPREVASMLAAALAESGDAVHFRDAPEAVREALLEDLRFFREHGEMIVYSHGRGLEDRTDEGLAALQVMVAVGLVEPGAVAAPRGMEFAGLSLADGGDRLVHALGRETRFLRAEVQGVRAFGIPDSDHPGLTSPALALTTEFSRHVRVYESERHFAECVRERWRVVWRVEGLRNEARTDVRWTSASVRALAIEPWRASARSRAPALPQLTMRGDGVEVDVVGQRVVVAAIERLPLVLDPSHARSA